MKYMADRKKLQNLDQEDELMNLTGMTYGRLQNLKGIQWGIPLSAAAPPSDEDLMNLRMTNWGATPIAAAPPADDELMNLQGIYYGGRLQNLMTREWYAKAKAAGYFQNLDQEDELINLSRAIYPQPPVRSTEQLTKDYYQAYKNHYNGRLQNLMGRERELQNLIRADEISKGISDAKGIYDQIKGFKFQNLDAQLI